MPSNFPIYSEGDKFKLIHFKNKRKERRQCVEEIKGYSLKKQKLKKWIYKNGYTQPQIAKMLNLSLFEFKKRLNQHELFYKKQIERLITFMGAYDAFQVIYFPTKSQRQEVYQKTFQQAKKEVIHNG